MRDALIICTLVVIASNAVTITVKVWQLSCLPIRQPHNYLNRYHGITVSESTVTRVLRSHGLGRLAKTVARRTIHSKRYAKKTPGHQVQINVKFVQMEDQSGQVVKRFQYTAVDDATRICALQIYPNHNQACAIQFIDYVIGKFPFRINMVRTDRGHEFQARFQ